MSPHTLPQTNPIDHFGTDLMDQIIEVEVDNAIRLLEAKGRNVDDTLAHTWNRSIREMLNHMFQEEHSIHSMLPRDIQTILKNMLQDLIEDEEGPTTASRKSSLPQKPLSLAARMQQFLNRLTGKKVPS